MEFKDWLSHTKTDVLELAEFISKIEPFFIESGFNASEFEKRVAIGVNTIDKQVEKSLMKEDDAKD